MCFFFIADQIRALTQCWIIRTVQYLGNRVNFTEDQKITLQFTPFVISQLTMKPTEYYSTNDFSNLDTVIGK